MDSSTFNSVETVVIMSIKFQLAHMEQYLSKTIIDKISVQKLNIINIRVDFEDSGVESMSVRRQTAEFLFSAFKWQGCRTYISNDLIVSLPSANFTRYSITFFIDNPSIGSVKSIMSCLNDMLFLKLNPNVPKLERSSVLNSVVSQRVEHISPVSREMTNPSTTIDVNVLGYTGGTPKCPNGKPGVAGCIGCTSNGTSNVLGYTGGTPGCTGGVISP